MRPRASASPSATSGPTQGPGSLRRSAATSCRCRASGRRRPVSTSISTRVEEPSDSSSRDGVDPYLGSTVADLLDQLAARTPAPGGGAAAALTCAMAAALVEMATSFASAQGLESVHERACRIREEVSDLAYADGRAYGVVLEALRMEPGEARTHSLD